MSDVITELAMEANDKTMQIARLNADNAKLREEIEAAKHDLQVFSRGSVQLEADNAKLRESVRRLMTQRDERLARAEAENAKLRELVEDYIDAPCTTCDCWQDEFRCWNYDGADCGLVARARELGVVE